MTVQHVLNSLRDRIHKFLPIVPLIIRTNNSYSTSGFNNGSMVPLIISIHNS